MKRSGFLLLVASAWGAVGLASTVPAAPAEPIAVVVGTQAPPIEQLAARECAQILGKLFGVPAAVSARVPTHTKRVVLVGSPATNVFVKQSAGAAWPKLTDQGHLVRSSKLAGKDVLVVGGGSPQATLWSVYELGYQFGVRYLLYGDAYPMERPAFRLTGFNVKLEPTLRLRSWRTLNDFAIGTESWGLADQKKLLRQLTKLKFNRVLMSVYPWQPFVDFEYGGVKKQTGVLWYGHRYPLDGDTPGRTALKDLSEFGNPDFARAATYADRVRAGVGLAKGILDEAHRLGMTAALTFSPLEFPKEFAAVLPGSRPSPAPEPLAIGPGAGQSLNDPKLLGLAAAQLNAYANTYPGIDAIYLSLPEFPDWVEHGPAAWKLLDQGGKLGGDAGYQAVLRAARTRSTVASGERGVRSVNGNLAVLAFVHKLRDNSVLALPGMGRKEVGLVGVDAALLSQLDAVIPAGWSALHFVDYTAPRVAAQDAVLQSVPASKVKSSLILTLADDNMGVLPQMTRTALQKLVVRLSENSWEGFSTRYWMPGDLSPAAHFLSRNSFGAALTPQKALEELATPMCGAGVALALEKGFAQIEEATLLMDQNDLGFSFPVPGMLMKHYRNQPVPAWWAQVRDLFGGASGEMYRANTRSRGGERDFTLYYAKRLDFALFYMNAVEAVRLAGIAKAKGDRTAQKEQLEKAEEALYTASNTLAEVARDQSDRGVLAILDAYAFRPLRKELASLAGGAR